MNLLREGDLIIMKKKFIGFIFLLLLTVPLLSACDEALDITLDILDSINTEESSETEFNKDKESKVTAEAVEGLKVHFIDVGQGDAILVQTEDSNMLIDAGDWNGDEVVPYLESQGVKEVDILQGTHEHADHIGQMDKVIENFEVSEVWMPGNTHTSQVYERVLTGIDENDIDYVEPRAGETYDLDSLEIEILSPSELTGDYNDDSIVMKTTYDEVSFMFTGDVEQTGEQKMLDNDMDLDANILKAGHHGSSTSNTDGFVKAVSPEVAIMSYGEDNKYNHPNGSVLDRFNKYGIEMYGTQAHGNIVITTDGESFNVQTEKDGTVKKGD